MKEKVQQRIDYLKSLATTPVKRNASEPNESARLNDSLSKSIRNAQEADIFLAELNTAFNIASNPK